MVGWKRGGSSDLSSSQLLEALGVLPVQDPEV